MSVLLPVLDGWVPSHRRIAASAVVGGGPCYAPGFSKAMLSPPKVDPIRRHKSGAITSVISA